MKRPEPQKRQAGDMLPDTEQHEFRDRGRTACGETSSVKERKERVGKRKGADLTRIRTRSPYRPSSKSKI